MKVLIKCVSLIVFCLIQVVLQGMQSQVQSTSSVTSSYAQVQTSQYVESKEITVPKIQRQHPLIGSLLAQPAPLYSFMSSQNNAVPVMNAVSQAAVSNMGVKPPVLHTDNSEHEKFYQTFLQAIDEKNDAILEAFLENYAVTYPLIKRLVQTGQFDYIDRMFDLIVTYDLAFDVNEIPIDEDQSSLLMIACENYGYAKSRDDALLFQKIIDLLLQDAGANIDFFVRENLTGWVTFLIEHGAEVNIFNDYGGSKLFDVCRSSEMEEILSKAEALPFHAESCYEALADTVEKDDITAASEAIHQGAIAQNIFTKKRQHILSIAAHNKNIALTEMLLTFAHLTLDYLVAANDYESLDFIFTQLPNYSITIDECKRLLNYAQLVHHNISHVIRRLNEQHYFLEQTNATDVQAEIAAMTRRPEPIKATYSRAENDFWCAVSQFRFADAEQILKKNNAKDLIRLRFGGPCYGHTVLSYALLKNKFASGDSFIQFLLQNYFDEIYPLIQDLVRNNDCGAIIALIQLGLNVNAHQNFDAPNDNQETSNGFVGEWDTSKPKPQYTNSLLKIAVEKAAEKGEKRVDVSMIVLLLKAGASITRLLQEKGCYLTNPEIGALLNAMKVVDPGLWQKIIDLYKHMVNKDMTLWDLGPLIYDVLTGSDRPLDLSELPKRVSSDYKAAVGRHVAMLYDHKTKIQLSSQKISRKRRFNKDEDEVKESEMQLVKRKRSAKEDSEALPEAFSPKLSLTPSSEILRTTPKHQFDPLRWLSAVSIA